MKKIVTVTSGLVLLLAVGCQQKEAKVELKTDDDKAFYSLGVMFGGRLKEIKLTEQELALVKAGLGDSASGAKLKVEATDHREQIDKIFKTRIEVATTQNKDAGKKYREGLKDYQTTASGLMYKIERPGEGKKPAATDTVEVHYKGTLIDGTVFDSSYDRKKTINFPLNRVIPGWTEGLQLLGEGGKMMLVIPSDLAYGDRGAPPNVPGGSTLIFEVELIKVSAPEPAAAPAVPAPAEKAPEKKKGKKK